MAISIDRHARLGTPRESSASHEADALLAAHFRNIARVSPAVAHDMHSFLNTMALNLELWRRIQDVPAAGRLDRAGKPEPPGTPGAPDTPDRPVDPGIEARERRCAALIAGGIRGIDRLINAAMNQLRLADRPQAPFDLRRIVDEAHVVMEPYARQRRIAIRATLPEVALIADGDRDRVSQAVLGLMLAAVDRTPEGGAVELAIESTRRTAVVAIRHGGGAIPDPGVYRAVLERHGARLRAEAGSTGASLEMEFDLSPHGS